MKIIILEALRIKEIPECIKTTWEQGWTSKENFADELIIFMVNNILASCDWVH